MIAMRLTIDDKADNFDAPKMAQMARKPRGFAISVQPIIDAIQMEYAPLSIMLYVYKENMNSNWPSNQSMAAASPLRQMSSGLGQ